MSKRCCQLSHELITQILINDDLPKHLNWYDTHIAFWFQLNCNNKNVCSHLAFKFSVCNLMQSLVAKLTRLTARLWNYHLTVDYFQTISKYTCDWLVACYRRFDTGLKKIAAWLSIVGVSFFSFLKLKVLNFNSIFK